MPLEMLSWFFNEFYIQPIINPAVQGYNLVNTLTYGAILLLLSIYVIYPFLNRKGIKFSSKFIFALLPYVLFGSALRVFEDMGIFQQTPNPLEIGFYTFTPGIWFLTAAITIAALLISKKLAKSLNQEYETVFAVIGVLVALPVLAINFLEIADPTNFIAIAMLTIGMVLLTYYGVIKGFPIVSGALLGQDSMRHHNLRDSFRNFFIDKLNILAVAGQALDGSATFIATQFGSCGEQHPVSAAIIDINPLSFILIKIVIALIILYLIDKEIKDPNQKGFFKMIVIILGMAPGLRDIITVAVGTCL